MARKAAALVQSVSTNHGFTDANKRTTIILAHLLVSRSGYKIAPLKSDGPLDAAMENLVLAFVRHELTFDQLIAWFKARLSRA